MSEALRLAKNAAKCLKSNNLDAAWDVAKQAMKADDSCLEVHAVFGAILHKRDEPEMAEKAYRRAIELEFSRQPSKGTRPPRAGPLLVSPHA